MELETGSTPGSSSSLATAAAVLTGCLHQTDAQGLIYLSRLTGRTCVCIYGRALAGLGATPVVEVTRLAGFVDALRELNVTLIVTP